MLLTGGEVKQMFGVILTCNLDSNYSTKFVNSE